MSLERSRFSGTASIYNRLSQMRFALKFWVLIASVLAVIAFGLRIYPTFRDDGTALFFLQTTAYEFTVKTGQPWPWLLINNQYREAVIQQTPQYHNYYGVLSKTIKNAAIESIIFGGTVLLLGFWLGRREAIMQTEDRHRRGSQLATPRALNRYLRRTEGKGDIYLGAIRIPYQVETRGICCIGMLGVGKTQLFNQILDTVVDRDERGIIFCAKGDDFLTTHWRDGDMIMCPADSRSVGWSLMADVTDVIDFDVIAESLIDDSNERTKTWSGGAKMIISGLLQYCYLSGNRSNRQICEVFSQDAAGMRDCLLETPGAHQAAGLLAEPTSSPSHSFYITVCLYSHPLRLLKHIDGDFSIARWIAEGHGRIYLPITPKLHRQLGSLYSVFIDLAITHHLSLPNDKTRRIWYCLDELSALGKIPGLPQLANVGRSKGAAILAGTQAYPQLDLLYGRDQRRALLNGFATKTIFRNEDESTLEELSKTLGRHEVERSRENLSTSFNIDRDGVTKMTEITEELLVKPDEIKNLPSLEFYFHSSGYPATRTSIEYMEWPQLIQPHIVHPAISLEAISKEYLVMTQKTENLKPGNNSTTGTDILM